MTAQSQRPPEKAQIKLCICLESKPVAMSQRFKTRWKQAVCDKTVNFLFNFIRDSQSCPNGPNSVITKWPPELHAPPALFTSLFTFTLAERRPNCHYMKQFKLRYCRCRPLVVPFVYYEFGTLSCAIKLTYESTTLLYQLLQIENYVHQWSPLVTYAL